MDCNSPTSAPRARRGAAGFTLLEVMLSTVITGIVFIGVLSAYTFLGRSLIRQGSEVRLEAQARAAIALFTQDVSGATSVDPTNMTATSLSLYEPASTSEVTYTYSASLGTLTRTTTGSASGPPSLVLSSQLTGLNFNYYNFVASASTTAPTPPPPAGVKEINMTVALAAGNRMSGSLTTFVVTSPRVALKNKVLLGASPGIP